MKYCADCGLEYQPSVADCAECGGTRFLDESILRKAGHPVAGELDLRNFVRVATAEDPLTAESFVGALVHEHIAVYSRPRASGSVDVLTTGATHPWWDITVPESDAVRAAAVLEDVRQMLEATEQEAARAAEEESARWRDGESES